MIAAPFHEGSGLGDQLFRYVTLRSVASDLGLEWGVLRPENFKGKSFMNIQMRSENAKFPIESLAYKEFNEKEIRDRNDVDIRSYDPEINFTMDNTIIDGCFEDDKYWGHHLSEMREWLKVEPISVPENVCVIGFRGGEYATVPDLFLDKEYWQNAIFRMRKNGIWDFEVHTDDPKTARETLQDFVPQETRYIQDIGVNWRSVRYAKHLIIANSAFYILPSLLGSAEEVIAPRYWARRNIGVWARPACFYRRFTYI